MYCQYGFFSGLHSSPPAPLQGGEGEVTSPPAPLRDEEGDVAQREIFELMELPLPSPLWRGVGGEESPFNVRGNIRTDGITAPLSTLEWGWRGAEASGNWEASHYMVPPIIYCRAPTIVYNNCELRLDGN